MSTGLRPQIAARVVQGGKSSNSCLRRALRPQTPCAGGPRPPHVRAVVENHDNSDCCGGVEAVGRLLVLDSPSFQMLCWIPSLLVFLVLDSTSFWLLCWIQPKKSCCAGFQLCCAGVQFSRPRDMTPENHAQGHNWRKSSQATTGAINASAWKGGGKIVASTDLASLFVVLSF